MKDRVFINRAIELAQLGLGKVSPNPMVGCIIANNDHIIGEGYHQKYGDAHAEVNAIQSVKDKSLLKGATVYVSLEPCSHFGKTPPCANLLIGSKVKRVVIASKDPNPLVAGKGIQKLKEAGIKVVFGVEEEKSISLNKRFFTFFNNSRPYIILKWAETADGFIAPNDLKRTWISDVFSRKLVHKWRAEEDAIMVGTNTALNDDPSLNIRNWSFSRQPTRIVLDQNLRLPGSLKVFDQSQKTIVINRVKEDLAAEPNMLYVKIKEEKIYFLKKAFERLRQLNIQSIIVEGGAVLLQSLIDAGLWDEARIFKSKNVFFKNGLTAPKIGDGALLIEAQDLKGDQLFCFSKSPFLMPRSLARH